MPRCVVLLLALLLAGCGGSGSRIVGEGDPDLAALRTFDRHPLYWVGERFEQWELEQVRLDGPAFVSLFYGTCTIENAGLFEGGSCSPPLQIQIQPLCAHLRAVARDPIWRTRRIRGAPVGRIDDAPVLFTNRVQVKVYRGQDTDPGLPLRVLRALSSANSVQPTFGRGDPIPPALDNVLAGRRACRD
jgi:hypothetical protein